MHVVLNFGFLATTTLARANTQANWANVRLVHFQKLAILGIRFGVYTLLIHAYAIVTEPILASNRVGIDG